jgi:hypothetical protein
VERLVECLGCGVNFLPVSRAQAFAKRLHFSDDLFPVGATEFIVLVTKVLPGMSQKQPAVFDMAGSKHELNDEVRMMNDETMIKSE